MKKTINRIIIAVLALCILFGPIHPGSSHDSGSRVSLTVSAAESWPSVSSSGYVEFKAASKIKVYKDPKFKKRGTSNPSKSYDAYISKNDTCYIFEMSSSYFLVEYPTSSGRRSGYIHRSDVTPASSPKSCKTSSGKADTYSYPGASSWGCVENNDKVYRLAESGDYTQIIYTAKSDNRKYKMGFIKTKDYKNCTGGSGSSNGSSKSDGSEKKQSKALSEALYKSSGAYISCGYDGYVNTSGRHEGIDFKYKLNADIYSLTDGTVLRVAKGSTGSGGLSTIAIYNKDTDKTVVYLHAAPSVKAGDKVRKGDKIGKESWRGISSKGSSHTHVEVRDGKQEYAAKSVGDPKLQNGNPSSFWKSLGYSIK